jgi:transposase
MNTREERGLVIAAVCRLAFKGGVWHVPSQSDGEKQYRVDLSRNSCTCPDHVEGGHVCKHQFAVKIVARREMSADGTVTEQRTFTFTEKKTYKRNWTAYSEAQCTEKHRFQELLHDLCRGLVHPERKQKRGRPRTPLADMVFASAYKIYSTVSGRRFSCDWRDAQEKGYVGETMHPNGVSSYIEDAELTPVFKNLIVRSAAPLRSLESDFAVDSSGFTSSRFVRWFDMKYGRERQEHDWIKVHIATGVRTNVVTAAAIYGRDAADAPILPELVKTTREGFDMKEVSADKGYLSVENVETIFSVGATPFIAFKANSTGRSGGLFEKMFHFYQYNQDEYMNHYHKRSNVESTFSMVKAKFGDSLRSKTDTAMRNEVYCKLLCHNLCRVIASQVELGIESKFWPDAISPAPRLQLHQ